MAKGKILFFSEEKGFGKIIDSEKNDYFFYINKIKNKPEKINKDDEVEFEYYESPKGLRATNIFFFEKIECPICSTLNYENDKNCKNIKCNWDLKYVKNGSFIGLSYTDIEEYNVKLRDYKNVYLNSLNDLYFPNSQIYSQSSIKNELLNNIMKFEYGKIIKGEIIFYNQITDIGSILGENNNSYFFFICDIDEPSKVQPGLLVNFTIELGQAKNIKIQNIEKHTKYNLNIKIDKYDLNNDDLYIDRDELLMWKVCPFKKMRWNDAMNFISDLLYAKHEDWRLPTARELKKFFISQKNWNIYKNEWGDYYYKFNLKAHENFWTSSDISKKMALIVYFYREGDLYDAWFDHDFNEISGIDFDADSYKSPKEDKFSFFCVRDI